MLAPQSTCSTDIPVTTLNTTDIIYMHPVSHILQLSTHQVSCSDQAMKDEKQKRSQSKKSNRKNSRDYSVSSISSISSSDDSYSDSELSSSNEEDNYRRKGNGKMDVVKQLKNWDLRFNGTDKALVADKYLRKLEDCIKANDIPDNALLRELSCVFTGTADIWFASIQKQIKTWRDFKESLKIDSY